MAYTAIITKDFPVKKDGLDDFEVSIHVLVTDGSNADAVVLDKNYSVTYNSNTDIDAVKNILQAKFVLDWQKFLSERNIYNAVKFSTLVNGLQTEANTYINQ